MPPRIRPLFALACFAFAQMGCGKKKSGGSLPPPEYAIPSSGKSASESEPQVVNGDTFEDYHYAYTIDRPNPAWEFLTEERAKSLNADATMAMTSTGNGGFFAVIPERLENSDLDSYSELLFSSGGYFGGAETKRITIGGLPAVVAEKEISLASAPFYYRVALVKRGDFFYQILGWSQLHRWLGVEREIHAIMDSFLPIPGRQPVLRANLKTPDAEGFGWWVRDRVYSHAATGLRIRCPERCRFMDATELQNIGHDGDDAGIAGGLGEIYLVVQSEPAPDADTIDQLGSAVGDLEGERGAEREVQIGGRAAREIEINGVVAEGGVRLEYRAASVYVDGASHRFLSWWPPENRGAALGLLDECYAGVDWLDARAKAALVDELRAFDPGNVVGLDYAMRNQVFYDFGNGFQLALPPDQIYRTETATTAPEEEWDGSRLNFSNLRLGVYTMVYASTLAEGQTHASYHELELDHLEQKSETSEKEIAGRAFLVTHFQTANAGTPFSQTLASTSYGDGPSGVVEFWLTVAGANREPDLEERIEAIASGLTIPPGGLQAVEENSGKVLDRRLGYRIAYPAGWTAKRAPMDGMESLASMAILTKGKDSVAGYVALCSPFGVQLDIAARALVQNMGVEVDASSLVEVPDTFAGQPGVHMQFEGERQGKETKVDIWTSTRDHTGFVCFVLDRGGLSPGEARIAADFFRLID